MTAFIEAARNEIGQLLAAGRPDAEILEQLCLSFELNVPGTKAGVTILDRNLGTFESAIFPTLSPAYAQALKGIAVADKPGSCALAVYEGRTVVSTNVAGDTRFTAAWKNLSNEHGLEALISIPVMRHDRKAVGTFVVAYPPRTGLSREELQTADAFAELCALVMARGEVRLARQAAALPLPAASVH